MTLPTPTPVRLRLATADDVDALRAIYAPFVVETPISFELEPPDGEEMGRRLQTTMPRHPFLVAVDSRTIAGFAYGSEHRVRGAYRWSADVSVYVDPARQRMGVGRVLYRALLTLLAAQGYRQAFAGITLPNSPSVGLHEAVGFRPVGVYRAVGWKLGAWHDVGWWQRSLDDSGAEPTEVRGVDELAGPAVRSILRGDASR